VPGNLVARQVRLPPDDVLICSHVGDVNVWSDLQAFGASAGGSIGGFQYVVEKVLWLPFLCLGLGLAAAGTLLSRLAEFVAGAPYVE
jgi:hypothetical protein